MRWYYQDGDSAWLVSVACEAERLVLCSLDSSSEKKKKKYICNASMIIPFLNSKTPKYVTKYGSALHQQQQDYLMSRWLRNLIEHLSDYIAE